MKRLLSIVAIGLLAGEAAAGITNIRAEGWPWRDGVALRFSADTTEPFDITGITATWEGQSSPVDLLGTGRVSGIDAYNVPTGDQTYSLNLQGLVEVNSTVRGFQVTVKTTPKSERMFLYVDYVNGTNAWYATAPESLLSATYLSKGMLFRRVLAGPVGTYKVGLPEEVRTACQVYDCATSERSTKSTRSLVGTYLPSDIGFSSDYFISCSWVTKAQARTLYGRVDVESNWQPVQEKLIVLRGTTNIVAYSEGDVRWPKTGFYVKPDSYIAQIRTKLANQLPSGWIVDLPTWPQQEVAHRANHWQTGWWNGGDATNCSDEYMSNIVSRCATWGRHNYNTHPQDYALGNHYDVCQLEPNDWGIWDPSYGVWAIAFCGLVNEAPGSTTFSGMDPIGPTTWTSNIRIQGTGRTDWELLGTVPMRSYTGSFASNRIAYRLVINTSDWMANK